MSTRLLQPLAAGLMLAALAGCVPDDGHYGPSGGGYYGGGYATPAPYPVYDSYPAYRPAPSYSYGPPTVDCNLPGKDAVTTPWECRDLQRRYGSSEREAERGTIHCHLPGSDVRTTPADCRRRQAIAGGRSERQVEHRLNRDDDDRRPRGRDESRPSRGRDDDDRGSRGRDRDDNDRRSRDRGDDDRRSRDRADDGSRGRGGSAAARPPRSHGE